jgi:hypothetical protein
MDKPKDYLIESILYDDLSRGDPKKSSSYLSYEKLHNISSSPNVSKTNKAELIAPRDNEEAVIAKKGPATQPKDKERKSILVYIDASFKLTVLIIIICLLIAFIFMVKRDAENKFYTRFQEEMIEIDNCKEGYNKNKCDPSTRVPSSESYCIEVEKCMSRDAYRTAQMSVELLDVIVNCLNKFWNGLSYKSIIGISITLIIVLIPWRKDAHPKQT